MSANARIMAQLIRDGSLPSTDSIQEYLTYTERVGDLVQTHSLTSVLLFDNKFRKDQAETGSSWAEHNWHASTFHLEKRSTPTSKAKAKSGSSMPVCLDYNNTAGCGRGTACKFRHVCAEKECGQAHPQFQHKPK